MTDLIPLDAAIAAMSGEFIGIDQRDTGEKLSTGWWETSYQCEFGAERLSAAVAAIQAIPAIDPAAIREAALREAIQALCDWQSDLNRHLLKDTAVTVGMAADIIDEMIGEKK